MAIHGYWPGKSLCYKGPGDLSQYRNSYRRADRGGCLLLETATIPPRRQTAVVEPRLKARGVVIKVKRPPKNL